MLPLRGTVFSHILADAKGTFQTGAVMRAQMTLPESEDDFRRFLPDRSVTGGPSANDSVVSGGSGGQNLAVSF